MIIFSDIQGLLCTYMKNNYCIHHITVLYVCYLTAASHTNVIAYPGQDVELTCNVTGGTASWFINGLGPYSVSQLFNGMVTGYNSSGNNLIINDIVMNDPRNNYEYQCTIYYVNGDPIFLRVSGEYICIPYGMKFMHVH